MTTTRSRSDPPETAPAYETERIGPYRARIGKVATRAMQYVAVLAGVVLFWYVVSRMVDNQIIVPGPGSVAGALVDIAGDGTLWEECQASLRRLATGYLVAVLVCIPLGVAMGLSRIVRALFDPVVELLRPISGLAWIPLGLLLFGVGDTLVVFIIFYGAAFPIVVNAATGVREIDANLVAAARTFGVGKLTVLFQVLLPGAAPSILVGLRTAAGTAWMSLVAAELIGGSTGLGFSLDYFRQLLMSDLMVAFIVVIGVLGFLTNALLRGIERWLTPWAEDGTR